MFSRRLMLPFSFHSFFGDVREHMNKYILPFFYNIWFDWDETRRDEKRTLRTVKSISRVFFASLVNEMLFSTTRKSSHNTPARDLRIREIAQHFMLQMMASFIYVNSTVSSEANLTISMNFNTFMELRAKLLSIFLTSWKSQNDFCDIWRPCGNNWRFVFFALTVEWTTWFIPNWIFWYLSLSISWTLRGLETIKEFPGKC